MRRHRPIAVHVSTVHNWDDSRVFRKMCLSLARAGYEVYLLAVADTSQEVDGVRILPVPAARSRVARVLLNIPRVALRAWRLRADVYHVHDPELIPLIPLLRLRGAKVVYDAHEDFPKQILYKEYIPSSVRPAVAAAGRLLCRVANRSANHVLAASPEVADAFDKARCTVVRNYPEDLPVTSNPPEYSRRDHRVVYVGTLTRARGVEQMVDAMAYRLLPPDWRFLLVGPHAPADFLEHLRQRPGWALVEHHGETSPPVARGMMADCRIGVAVLQPVGQYADVLPTKLFEYMSLGIPVVSADYPNCRRVVESSGCGLLVDPTDPRAIAEATAELAAHPEVAEEMGLRGRAAVQQRFNWGSEEKLLLGTYAAVLSSKARRR